VQDEDNNNGDDIDYFSMCWITRDLV